MAGRHYSGGRWLPCSAQPGNCPVKDENGNSVPHATTDAEMEAIEAQYATQDPYEQSLSKNPAASAPKDQGEFGSEVHLAGVDKRVARADEFHHFVADPAERKRIQDWLDKREAQDRRNGPFTNTTLQYTKGHTLTFVTNNPSSGTYELHNLDGSPVEEEHSFVKTSADGESNPYSPMVTTTFVNGRRAPEATETIVIPRRRNMTVTTTAHYHNGQMAAKGNEPGEYSTMDGFLQSASYTTANGRRIGEWSNVEGMVDYDHDAASEYIRETYEPTAREANAGSQEAVKNLDNWLKFNKPLLDAYNSMEETNRYQQKQAEQSRHRVRNFLRGNR